MNGNGIGRGLATAVAPSSSSSSSLVQLGGSGNGGGSASDNGTIRSSSVLPLPILPSMDQPLLPAQLHQLYHSRQRHPPPQAVAGSHSHSATPSPYSSQAPSPDDDLNLLTTRAPPLPTRTSLIDRNLPAGPIASTSSSPGIGIGNGGQGHGSTTITNAKKRGRPIERSTNGSSRTHTPERGAPDDDDELMHLGDPSKRGGDGAEIDSGAANENEKKKIKVKVGARASIACITCRKRKVRCSGDWPTCNFCVKKKLPCEYDGHPAETGGSLQGSTFASLTEDEVLPSTEIMLEALDPFFAHHYDTFYFLHRPTLTEAIKNGTAPKELVCCVLAFAARLCRPLQELHPSSPSAASEHFATLASQLLSLPPSSSSAHRSGSGDGEISLVRCQSYLMLGLYECTDGSENKGWLKIGAAIRLAQVMKLGFEDEDEGSSSRPRTDPLLSETRRRTFWALFLLDRTVSDGKERPCSLKAPLSMMLRMPGPDHDFLAGKPTPGARFEADPPPWSQSVKATHAPKVEVDLYGMTLRVAEIWQQVATYIGEGGRNIDRRAPWSPDSTFAELRQRLVRFGEQLTPQLRATRDSLLAHTLSNEGRLFGMLHLLYATATLVLHRDYLPFLPPADYLASSGPADGEPLYDDPVAPEGWWSDSIHSAILAAHTITQVQTHLLSHDQILTHPFAGFAALTAGTMQLHLKYWPQNGLADSTPQDVNERIEATTAILSALKEVYPVGAHWCDGLAKLQLLYYNHVRGVLDSDPTKVRAGVIKLLRTAKEEHDHSRSPNRRKSSATTSNQVTEGSAQVKKEKRSKKDPVSGDATGATNVGTPSSTTTTPGPMSTTTPLPSTSTSDLGPLSGATSYLDPNNALFTHLDLHSQFALPAPTTTPGGGLSFDGGVTSNDFWFNATAGPLGSGWNGFGLMSSFDTSPWTGWNPGTSGTSSQGAGYGFY